MNRWLQSGETQFSLTLLLHRHTTKSRCILSNFTLKCTLSFMKFHYDFKRFPKIIDLFQKTLMKI